MILLVVDTQKENMNDALYNFDTFVYTVKKLIENARKNDVEVVFIRHDDGVGNKLTRGKAGYEIYDDFIPFSKEKVFDKIVNSPFKQSGLLEYLKKKKENQLIIVGLQSDFCINTTIQCAFEHGFEVFVPANANTTCDNFFMSGKQTYEYYNEFLWKNRFATCLSFEETLEMMRK